MRINFRRCKGRKCRTDLWNDKPLPAPETKDRQNFMREHHLYNRLFPSYMSPPSIHPTLFPLSSDAAITTELLNSRITTELPTLCIDKLKSKYTIPWTASLCDRFSTSPQLPLWVDFMCRYSLVLIVLTKVSLCTHNTFCFT